MSLSWTTPKSAGAWAVLALGVIILLVGLVLLAGGVWLAALGGSWFYFLAGAALIASGWLLALRSKTGAWVYLATFAVTVLWALSEVQLDGWALVPRLVGPLVLLALVIAALPVLDRDQGRRLARVGGVAWVALVASGLLIVGLANQPDPVGRMPDPIGGMGDPSLRATGEDWPAYGGTYAARRFSPLTQITPQNVDTLERAWVYRTGDTPEEDWGAETTPIKVGDRLFLCSARNILIALEASTGTEIWRYDPEVSDDYIPYTAACRGVAYHETAGAAGACARRVIEGTLDGRLVAVDADTGAPCADFGEGGSVDITAGMGEVAPGMVSITSPPVVVRDVVVTGHQVLDGQSLSAPSGVIQAYNVRTGALAWAWDMTNPDWTGAPPEGEAYTRGTPNMWTMATADAELGLVYLPMGNSAVDYWSGARTPEEDEYTAALVALDAQTGRPRWSFRTVNVDVWDYDLGSQPTLIDFPTGDGATTPALVLASKQGEIYILDRATGEPLHPVDQRPVPGGGVEPQRRSPVQPFSRYHSLRMPDLTEADMWGMSLIDQMICRIQFRRATYDGIYTPPTVRTRWIQYPGYNGGSDWGGVAVDPMRGVLVANYNDMPNYNRLVPRAEADRLGWAPRSETGRATGSQPEGAGDPQAGAPYAIDVNAGWRMPVTGMLCKEPPYGGIRAIDLASGRTIWDRPFGTARRNGPFGIPSGLPLTIGTPNNGGAVVTGGGVIFIAATTDNLIHAINLRDGETLWTDVLPAGGQASPITYAVDGRQYVVMMAGGHHFMETPPGDYVIAYALPQ